LIILSKLLLASKADVNARLNNNVTPLHLAAAFGSQGVVRLLLANNADVNARDDNGWANGVSASRCFLPFSI